MLDLWLGALQHYYGVPVSYCWSPSLLPQPADWPVSAEVVGFCQLEASERMHYQPPKDLIEFLAAGEPPVYIGFGSMALDKPQVCTPVHSAIPHPPYLANLKGYGSWLQMAKP